MNGIRHLLTAPRSPTTTEKVERWHKTMRAEFLRDHDRRHATLEELQAALDVWVEEYNTVRPHQALGMRPPIERFQLAPHISAGEVPVIDPIAASAQPGAQPAIPLHGVQRWARRSTARPMARRSGSVDKPVMGAFAQAPIRSRRPAVRVHPTPPIGPTDRPKDSNQRVRLTESQTRRETPHPSSLAYETSRRRSWRRWPPSGIRVQFWTGPI